MISEWVAWEWLGNRWPRGEYKRFIAGTLLDIWLIGALAGGLNNFETKNPSAQDVILNPFRTAFALVAPSQTNSLEVKPTPAPKPTLEVGKTSGWIAPLSGKVLNAWQSIEAGCNQQLEDCRHGGIDIMPLSANEPVVAPINGIVVLVGGNPQGDNDMIIDTPDGCKFEVNHLTKIMIKTNEKITQGRALGYPDKIPGWPLHAHFSLACGTGQINEYNFENYADIDPGLKISAFKNVKVGDVITRK